MDIYDVIIVGAGPAGIFAALTLVEKGVDNIIILEEGRDIEMRERERELLKGWGGAGAFSDGKLTLSPEIGGSLIDFIPQEELKELLKEADRTFLDFGAPEKTYGGPSEAVDTLKSEARMVGLELIPTKIRHLGTENCPGILRSMREKLQEKIVIKCGIRVEKIISEKRTAKGVVLRDGSIVKGRFIVVAPGRVGAEWMKGQAKALRLSTVPSPVDIGLRVEVPAAVLERITNATYESKLIYYSKTFDDKVRTFCMNPHGEVVLEANDNITTVNGHSYAHKRTENTNFALLVSTGFTDPFHEPIRYGRYIAQLANILGEGVIVQRLGDLLAGRRSTPERISYCITRPTLKETTPGDLSFVLPYRYIKDIIETLETMDRIAPGVFSRHTLLYGVEVKFYSNRIKLSPNLESEVKNLFVIGDGAGITRGLIQSSVSGIIAGKEIGRRIKGYVRQPKSS